ncbi:MAG: hypothetical protein JWM61_837 [Micrococcaceae bacterium]|uniref:Uncharacterized protein n=1 Tax=Arthrobacter cheniae TaxID=1258888 RepID=A0A3A5M6U2_9MICC|nr:MULTISPECIES: hypothetical protein [Arthrobacter]MCU1632185.1 hypothetical protein [Micrococcaceae bacterium]MEC5198611.1 hypothetical protein [Arthrobacter sp. PL16]RJT83427.1 hypothetical protein D6T63_03050 [Arthrobacter cheniae]
MQFETAYTAMTTSFLTLREVHLHYLNSGGSFDELEVDAYLHGLAPLPREERNCLAQALNELLDDLLAAGLPACAARATYSGSFPADGDQGVGRVDATVAGGTVLG